MAQLESITFLIGGKFSIQQRRLVMTANGMQEKFLDDAFEQEFEEMQMAPRSLDIFRVNWFVPYPELQNVKNFYRFASQTWSDIYGDNPLGTVGHDITLHERDTKERFFFWENTAHPNFANVTAAAEKLVHRCEWVRDNHSANGLRIRLVGHSAGCLVANRATQLAAQQGLTIDDLILCAPPVPDCDEDFGAWSVDEIQFAFPNLSAVSAGKFYYIPVIRDWVLRLHNVGTRYDNQFVSDNYERVKNGSIVPPRRYLGRVDHWEPVRSRTWERKYLSWYENN